jgi:hypothetical protein
MDVQRNLLIRLKELKVKILKELNLVMAEPLVSQTFVHPPLEVATINRKRKRGEFEASYLIQEPTLGISQPDMALTLSKMTRRR